MWLGTLGTVVVVVRERGWVMGNGYCVVWYGHKSGLPETTVCIMIRVSEYIRGIFFHRNKISLDQSLTLIWDREILPQEIELA